MNKLENSNVEDSKPSDIDYNHSNENEHKPCPEFEFPRASCFFCNGYYGPCFEEPVCTTCHSFLFPDNIGMLQLQVISEKTDDEDSGNDEPTDLCYNSDRRSGQHQHGSSQISNNFASNQELRQQLMKDHLLPQQYFLNLQKLSQDNDRHKVNTSNVTAFQNITSTHNHPSITGENINPENATKKNTTCTQDFHFPTNEILEHDFLTLTGVKNIKDLVQDSSNFRITSEVAGPSRPKNLSERLEILTNHKHIEHEPVSEPGVIERLPPEVLLTIFSYLDDLSLWSAMNVCRRWCGLLSTHLTSTQWQQYVKLRWPLYKPVSSVADWYKVYDLLASSTPCRTCLIQTSLQTKLPRMEENSWRRNRLRSELKSLRMDPPEGIEATPLDQMCCHWQATITGPTGSPYEGGLFFLYLQVPYSYPMRPPVVRFLTKILHPNVSRHGDVGIDSIHHNWSLALTISKVLISVQSLLTDPYCQVCMEPELGEMYMNDKEKFEEVARLWTWKYAIHDVITPY
ncbi:uncharacterized protein LOC127288057 [Leptopilina boulardi]|uniref:uncharacterized protein LOC127288057 n=1 Tax=Leptopilina boulardi TaxID=63433 RepID=UPI0021F658D4|nr:uncharacterized protein LOC127288057 [Leptopilina boulardi]